MSDNSRKTKFCIKHLMAKEWLQVYFLSEDQSHLKLIFEDENNYFEIGDKIFYSESRNNHKQIYNSVVTDIDFVNINKTVITIQKHKERRQSKRYSVDLPAKIFANNFATNCSLRDISLKGIQIKSSEHINPNEDINISIFLTDTDTVDLTCRVVYKTLSEEPNIFLYGLKIIFISTENKLLLKDFIKSIQ